MHDSQERKFPFYPPSKSFTRFSKFNLKTGMGYGGYSFLSNISNLCYQACPHEHLFITPRTISLTLGLLTQNSQIKSSQPWLREWRSWNKREINPLSPFQLPELSLSWVAILGPSWFGWKSKFSFPLLQFYWDEEIAESRRYYHYFGLVIALAFCRWAAFSQRCELWRCAAISLSSATSFSSWYLV